MTYVHGPRQCGKSTLVHTLCKSDRDRSSAIRAQYEYVTFDDPSALEFAIQDPLGFVDQLPEFAVVDEIQLAKSIFRPLKLAVDSRKLPGRFVLTGSAQASLMGDLSDALVGRLALVRMYPLAQCEINQQIDQISFELRHDSLFSMLARKNQPDFAGSSKPLGRTLAKMITSGGFPEPLQLNETQRGSWNLDYMNTIVERDIRSLTTIRKYDAIPNLLSAAAVQTATLFNLERLGSTLSLSRPTIQEFVSVLARLFLIEYLPAWSSNQLTRLIKSPKIYMSDTGLACALLRVDEDALWQDRRLFGRMVENLVFHELVRQASWQPNPPALFHYRDKDQVEVDFIMEHADRTITGIEVKASRSVTKSDFKGLRKVANATSRFNLGVVLYDGEWVIPFEPNMFAVPLRRLFENRTFEKHGA